VIRPNQRSTRLSHDALVGVKCSWKGRIVANPYSTAGRLWVPIVADRMQLAAG
jgi:hypothetical protein